MENKRSRLIAQARPSGTSAVAAFTTKAATRIDTIVIANTTAGSVNYSVYLDQDGTTYDQSTALFYSVALAANTTALIQFDSSFFITDINGRLAIQTSSGNALTFSIFGLENPI